MKTENSPDPFPPADVVIVGAGTAGSAAALLCAQRGLSVLCLERGALERAGARWVNGVAASAFDAAGIARPRAPELLAAGVDFHLLAGWGPERVTMRDHELLEVDMRLLVARLQREARAAGAEFMSDISVKGFEGQRLMTSAGALRARWYVDASGMAGARLLDPPRPRPQDLCAAAQQVHQVVDPAAARMFYARHGARVGDTICFSGIEGGYSIVNVRVELGEVNQVAILTGSIPALGWLPGRVILRDFVEQHSWIGPKIFGGSRAIPLGRPHAQLYRDNIAAIGDAAGQVFSAHGSGVGPGMLAARLLADALADGRDLKGYQDDWQRRYGGLFDGYVRIREFNQALTGADLRSLMTSGLVDADMVMDGLVQRMPRVRAQVALAKLAGALRAPRLAADLLPVLAHLAASSARHAALPAARTAHERVTNLLKTLRAR